MKKGPNISIIVPVYNEEKNVSEVARNIYEVTKKIPTNSEIIFVDDGSNDATASLLENISTQIPLTIIVLRRNFGQTAALMSGIDIAQGQIIVTMDGDGQNDPEDIPNLLKKIEEGYDVVSGWRKNRKDARIRRNFLSRIANRIISWVSGITLNDYGCTLKAYRREAIAGFRMYGEMHRLIPIYVHQRGGRIAEIPVRHHPRRHGFSNYGLERIFKVLLDLLVSQFFTRFHTKPVYLFGGIAFIFFILSSISGLSALFLKFFLGTSFIKTPLPLMSAFTFLVGVICLLMGIQSEQLMRIHYESQNLKPYIIRKIYTTGERTSSNKKKM